MALRCPRQFAEVELQRTEVENKADWCIATVVTDGGGILINAVLCLDIYHPIHPTTRHDCCRALLSSGS